jgi:hypothetical protein
LGYYGLSDYDEWQGEDRARALALPDEEEDRARRSESEVGGGRGWRQAFCPGSRSLAGTANTTIRRNHTPTIAGAPARPRLQATSSRSGAIVLGGSGRRLEGHIGPRPDTRAESR